MITVQEIRDWMDSFAPYQTAEEWDNSGLLLGRSEQTVTGILIALDVTKEVLQEAKEMGANLILTHHPFFLSPLKRITDEDYCGTLLLTAAEEKIALLCAHTNLDVAKEGINTQLCRLLGIETEEKETIHPYQIGRLKQDMTLKEWIALTQEKLHCYGLKYTGDLNQTIRTVGVCSGSGSQFAEEAGTDVFLTADVKYHDHQKGAQLGICLVDAGHFETETIICPILEQRLNIAFPDLPVNCSVRHRGFYQYF